MSRTRRKPGTQQLRVSAPLFAALGDETRLALLDRLGNGAPCSITSLTAGSSLSRQAITKHLRILEGAGLVRGIRQGRESLFEIAPDTLDEAIRFLERISNQWDQALARLKSFVEE